MLKRQGLTEERLLFVLRIQVFFLHNYTAMHHAVKFILFLCIVT